MRRTKLNTLGLDSDLDGVYLLQDVERAFGVAITDKETASILTVGDLFAIVERNANYKGGGKCRTAMSFFRLRQALRALGVTQTPRPNTNLSAVSKFSPRRLYAEIERRTDLTLPSLTGGWFTISGVFLLVAALLSPLVLTHLNFDFWQKSAAVASGVLVAALLLRFDRLRFGEGVKTFGDLAEQVSSLNYSSLVLAGGRNTPQEMWKSFVTVVAEHADDMPRSEITPTTLLLAQGQTPPQQSDSC
ncbi:MAG: acyl carrier protein [Oricola sp.]|nr:acyl carrier protein [Oricola sp.]